MALYKRGGVYWYEFVFGGTRYRESAKTGNERAARQIESAARVRLAKGNAGIEEPVQSPTLREFSKEFIQQIGMECAGKPRTIEFYKEKLSRLSEHPGLVDTPLDSISQDLIESYKRTRVTTRSRHGKPVSPASVNRELATLRRLLRMAVELNRLKSVPRIRLLKGEKNREFVLSREGEKRYLSALPPDMRSFCIFLVDTGLRVGECLRLEWPQVDLRSKPGFVTVRAGHAKSGKARTIPLTTRARAILEGIRGRRGLVFRNSSEGPLYHTWLNQQHAAIRTLLAFPADFVLHSLRHTFGTRLGETGAEAFTIMNLMGHSTVTVSQKYVHPSTQWMRQAIERLDSASKVPTNSPTDLKAVGRKKQVSSL